MKLEELEISLREFKGIGIKTALKLEKNKIKTIKDLLYFFPYKYLDLTQIKKISELKINETAVIVGKITNLKIFPTPKRKMFILQGIISDETGSLKVIWYNQPFLAKTLKNNLLIALIGKLVKNRYGLNFQPLKFEILNSKEDFKKRIVPVYSEIEGIKSSFFEKLIKNILEKYDIKNLLDPLPLQIISKLNYPSLGEALYNIHKPKNFKDIDLAKERLSFEELLYLELALLYERKNLSQNSAPVINKDENLIKEFLKQFNFNLTQGQKKVLEEIFNDLKKNIPMNRLLQGETGSGKTLIAEIISLHFVLQNLQVIFMAPTEILAQQHFQRFLNHFVNFDVGLGLITSGQIFYGLKGFRSRKKINEINRLLSTGQIKILIGTHSLIENSFNFQKVGLVIIDEQQRFGVEQRKKLLSQTKQEFLPHFLSMTATPIPRTLALAFYGDLDFSYLEEKPFGQKEIKTFIIPPSKENIMWQFVKKEINEGHQIFIICPRVEEKEDEIRSVKEEYERVKKIFETQTNADLKTISDHTRTNTDFITNELSEMSVLSPKKSEHPVLDQHRSVKIAMLHGKMSSEEKEKILRLMQKNEIQILISSSVVEVGIDLPLATTIIIQSPERFGLAQLYQLKGRVGRGVHQGYCFLVPHKLSLKAKLRLKYFLKAKNALELSEYDLKLRGAGELLGERQAGLPDLAMQSLNNIYLLEKAKKIAKEIIEISDNLEKFPYLKQQVNKRRNLLLS
jgi:ATP-dependent DNA helicase RecG